MRLRWWRKPPDEDRGPQPEPVAPEEVLQTDFHDTREAQKSFARGLDTPAGAPLSGEAKLQLREILSGLDAVEEWAVHLREMVRKITD